MPVPMVGICSYGTFTFPGNTEALAFQYRPQYDSTGRTVTHNVISITLRFIVNNPGGNTDAQVQAILNVLNTPAQPFHYQQKGFGDFAVNAGGPKDVLWGPKPQVTGFRHLGGPAGTEVTWSVDVATVICADAVFEGQPLEFVYRLEFLIDKSGYTTRRYSGHVTVPQTRLGPNDRRLKGSADDWRERVEPALIPGFRRRPGTFTLDETKARLDFSFEDVEEGPNYLPASVVDGSFSHSLQSSGPGFTKWLITMRASFETDRTVPPEYAWTAFVRCARQRLDILRANLPQLAPNAGGQRGLLVPLHLSVETPDAFGHPVTSFQMNWQLTSSPILTDTLRACAIWAPVGDSWQIWAVSMNGGAFNDRGHAGLRFDAADEQITDLCQRRAINPPRPSTNKLKTQPHKTIEQLLADPCPAPENSWLDYECAIMAEDGQNSVVLNPLPKTELSVTPITSFFGDLQGYQLAKFDREPEGIIQNRAGGNYVIRLVGQAARYCYNIPPPQLLKVGEVEVVPANRLDMGEGLWTWTAGVYGDHQVIAARWNLRYMLKNAPRVRLQSLQTQTLGGSSITSSGILQNGKIFGDLK